MSALASTAEKILGKVQARLPALRPSYPPVAVEVEGDSLVLVRLRTKGRGKPVLEAHKVAALAGAAGSPTLFRPVLGAGDEITRALKDLFVQTGTKPGKISVVLPDNVAKINLLNLPERPASRRQLEELIRFKLRRSIPFRMDDAVLSYQVIPGTGRQVDVLVSLMHRLVVQQYESAVIEAGARPGLIDLCTPNLLNLCRKEILEENRRGKDSALLNYDKGYFSLVILRSGRIIFFRSKSFHVGGEETGSNVNLARELNHSFAYYQEKLEGEAIETLWVRSIREGKDEWGRILDGLGVGAVKIIDPAPLLQMVEGMQLDPELGQRLAPAIAVAAGRG